MCEMRGAYLVHVDAASEDDFITSLMKTNGGKHQYLLKQPPIQWLTSFKNYQDDNK